MRARIIHTIGHSTRSFDDVVSMLRSSTVTQLVDVRSFPSSRRFPQWDRENIERALPPDIGYQWMRQLGGRRHTPVGVPSPNGAWRVKAFRDYADYMRCHRLTHHVGNRDSERRAHPVRLRPKRNHHLP